MPMMRGKIHTKLDTNSTSAERYGTSDDRTLDANRLWPDIISDVKVNMPTSMRRIYQKARLA